MIIIEAFKINSHDFYTFAETREEAYKICSSPGYYSFVWGKWLIFSSEIEMVSKEDVIWLDPQAGELKVHLFEALIPQSLNFVGKFYLISQERVDNAHIKEVVSEKCLEPFQMDINKPLACLDEAASMGFKPFVECPYLTL